MINRIIASLIFVCLLFAISIKVYGLTQGLDITHVELSKPFMSFLRSTSLELEDFKIAIPDIPSIPPMEETSGAWAILEVLVSFVNGVVNLLNFIIMVLNTIIQLIQFIVLLIKNFIILRDEVMPIV